MRTPAKEHTRAERLRQHAAAVDQARNVAASMSLLVRGREARARDGEALLEIGFADIDVDGRSLPAAVWVALRHGDVVAAVDAMTAVSQTSFVIDEREVLGEGYRLQTVPETLPVPEVDLLITQLSRALDVPRDVLTVLANWGPDDPRTALEIDDLLASRFAEQSGRGTFAPAEHPAPDRTAPAQPPGRLTMTVGEVAQVLRLDAEQTRALGALVRNATLTLTGE